MNDYIRLCRYAQERHWHDCPQIYTMRTHVNQNILIKGITSNEQCQDMDTKRIQ